MVGVGMGSVDVRGGIAGRPGHRAGSEWWHDDPWRYTSCAQGRWVIQVGVDDRTVKGGDVCDDVPACSVTVY